MSAGAEDDDALALQRPRRAAQNGASRPPAARPQSARSEAARRQAVRPNLELVHGPTEQPHEFEHGPDHPDHPHHILIEPEEDRWKWRRKIRQNPRQLFFYRWAVGFAGLFFIALGFVTGPLPGPGGIPLVLLGLAIWASEFEWAHKLMQWFKGQLQRYRGWSVRRKVGFWICFFACCATLGYLYLLLIGFPAWMPQFMHDLADRLPGVG